MSGRRVEFFEIGPSIEAARAELDAAWANIFRHGVFVGGPEVTEFEDAFARYCGANHCIGVANGTDALELALMGLGIEPGAEVIVPANTFIATAEAVCNIGAVPRFVDVDESTLLMTADTARPAINSRTAAIIAVHLFGQPCDLDPLTDLASANSLILVEDAAQAHGAVYRGRPIGSHSAVATFSFYPGKNLGALGDGGAVVTSDPVLADRVRSLGAHGRAWDDRHSHVSIGRNSRLDTLQAAALHVRLGRLADENANRRTAHEWYEQTLPDSVELVAQAPDRVSSHHLVVAMSDGRDILRSSLARRGIDTGIHYPTPCHLQPAYAQLSDERLPVVELAASRIISLPMSGHIDREAVTYVCDQISNLTRPVVG